MKLTRFLGATPSLVGASTANTIGESISCPPLSAFAAQAVTDPAVAGTTGVIDIQGSLDGVNWVGLSTNNNVAGPTLFGSTAAILPVTHIRAVLTSASTGEITVLISGR